VLGSHPQRHLGAGEEPVSLNSAALAPDRGAAYLSAMVTRAARSPLMEQYQAIKRDHPDAFLFFRLGDFYEMFFEDAVEGARLLGLTLTSRNKRDPEPIPMCGVPWHQRDAYIARLLRLGRKVAVCDQLSDPAASKGLVERGVTEVLTPGSVTGDSFLEAHASNFLAALWPAEERLGVCLADASTGGVNFAEVTWDEAAGFLSRLGVAEWLLPAAEDLDRARTEHLEAVTRGLPGAHSAADPARTFDPVQIEARWSDATRALLAAEPAARTAVHAALAYLRRVQGGAAFQPARLERWSDDDTLRYDAATARHLELFQPQPGGVPEHTLWHHVNFTCTAPGARRLRAWLERPLFELDAIRARHDAVAAWHAAGSARLALRERLRGLPDLERLAARVALRRATPRDLGALRDGVAALPGVGACAAALAQGVLPEALSGIPALEEALRAALVDEPPPVSTEGGVIRPGHDAHRDGLHALAHSGKRWIAELEAAERARTGIASLKVGFNRVFGYYLEVTRPHLDKVPAEWERRQTLTTAERFVTAGLKVKEAEVLGAEDKLRAREHELFVALREQAAAHVPALQRAADALAALDAYAALAEAAARHGWTRPEVDDSDALELDAARHPVVERLLPRGTFVPNDCRLDGWRRQILLLTGPNMGGKSTYLRQVALTVLLAQAGSFVPATRARIGRVDRLFTRVGAADRLGAGHSTFMVEMTETADILRSATARSLVLLDEVGRGTATWDGLALAWAVTEHLHAADGPRPRTVFATHYHELTRLAGTLPRLANAHVTVEERDGRVVFLHGLADGPADRSYGIHVAELAGLPPRVLARAREVLAELESERTVEHLDRARRPAPPQLPLFGAPATHPVLEDLRALQLDQLTPLEALNRVAEWKRRCGEE
jgi:DNA mismatch repair protein MutS